MSLSNLLQFAHAVTFKRKTRTPRQRRLAIETLEGRSLLSAVTMTDQEQLLLELINRTRANPAAEAARYGIDLNKDLPAGTLSNTPKQPLAPHQSLINAAGLHSQDMLDQDYFDHQNLAGKSPNQRALDAGYTGSAGENIGWGGSTGPIDNNQHVYTRHERLFLSTGHRVNMLHEPYDEVGTGVRYGVFTSSGTDYNASMVTELLGVSSGYTFITGVAFTDSVVNDNFYNIGESAAGIRVLASSSLGATYETVTGNSGGYSLQVPNGTYRVAFSGGGYEGAVTFENVTINGSNIKVDLDTGDANWVIPPSLPSVTLSASTFSITEDSGESFVVTLSRTGDLASPLTVHLTVAGTAVFGTDFVQTGATTFATTTASVSFAAGLGTATLSLRPLADTSIELNETLILGIAANASYTPGEPTTLSLSILNDDTDRVQIDATSGDDVVTVNLSGDYQVTVNGVTRSLDRASVRSIVVNGGDGTDQLIIIADSVMVSAVLQIGQLQVTGADYQLAGNSWENVTVIATAGSTARATLYDSPSNDNLFARPQTVSLTNGTYTHRLDRFARVDALATSGDAGGSGDQAYFYDSAGNDSFFAHPTHAYMSGNQFYNYSEGFDRAIAIATAGDAGGSGDQAYLYDSAGNDTLNSLPGYSYLTGPGYYSYAQGFDRVIAFARAGSADARGDWAYLYDSAGDDTLNARPEYAYLSGTGFFNYAEGFGTVLTYSTNTSSFDRAYLYDSAGDDVFTGTTAHGVMRGTNFVNLVAGFDEVIADSRSGGTDIARLYDSAGNDVFVATPTAASLTTPTYRQSAVGFERVTGFATAGNSGGIGDQANLYDSPGNDILNARPEYAYITGTGYYSYAEGFNRVRVFANAGNAGGSGDRAYLYDSNGADTLTTRPNSAVFSGSNTLGRAFYNYAEGFQQVLAYASAGGFDQAYYYDSAGNDTFIATPELAYLSGTGFLNYGAGFDRNVAVATAGDLGGVGDVATLYGSSGDDTLNALPAYTYLSGAGFYSYAGSFNRVLTRGMGGTDLAYFYGSAGADQYYQQGDLRSLTGAGYYFSADGFRAVIVALNQGGIDTANLYDTTGNDTFIGQREKAEFYSSSYYTKVSDADTIYLYGSAGGTNRLTAPTAAEDLNRILYDLVVAGVWI